MKRRQFRNSTKCNYFKINIDYTMSLFVFMWFNISDSSNIGIEKNNKLAIWDNVMNVLFLNHVDYVLKRYNILCCRIRVKSVSRKFCACLPN